jgi:adenine-specific DNA-methyltransferase
MDQLRTVAEWGAALGLLPVPLVEDSGPERYVLMNGSSGNFCLDFAGEIDRYSQRSMAWSCDVGHYVTCQDESVTVNHWDRRATEESYSWRSVVSQVHEFHRHLERTSPDRSKSIAAHVLRVFRQIRSALHERDSGGNSLSVLLHLLASVALKQHKLSSAELEACGLSAALSQWTDSLPRATWSQLHSDLVGTGRYDVLRPDFELVLRHASGVVFQDAHLEAQLHAMGWLPGLEQPAAVASGIAPKETGIYYTPPALARTLAEEAVRDLPVSNGNPLRLFDPACGSGELLKECLRLLKLKNYSGRILVSGWDKSHASVDLASFVLSWERRHWLEGQIEISLEQRDSLGSDWPQSDVLIMNPPFKSWVSMTPEERDGVTQLIGDSNNKPNLAMAFAVRASRSIAGGGSLAMIAPNSLLEASSSRLARQVLSETLAPCLIAMELIRVGGHLPKGGYDVRNGSKRRPATAPAIH